MWHEIQLQLQSLAGQLAVLLGIPAETALEEREMLLALPVMLKRSGMLVFAASSAFQDLKFRSIAVKTFILYGLWGVAAGALQFALGERTSETVLSLRVWVSFFAPFFPGLLLLILAKTLRGAIGSGDACYFLTAACFLSFGKLIWVLCTGLLLSAAAGLFLICRGRLQGRDCARLETLPLPFAAVLFPAVCAAVLM